MLKEDFTLFKWILKVESFYQQRNRNFFNKVKQILNELSWKIKNNKSIYYICWMGSQSLVQIAKYILTLIFVTIFIRRYANINNNFFKKENHLLKARLFFYNAKET